MSNNDATRPRGATTIEARIRSRRAKDGALTIFNRIREEAIRNCADSIAHANPFRQLTEDDVTRSVQLFCSQHPDAARSTDEQTAILRMARHNEMQPIPIRDLDKIALGRMTARERLDIANGAPVSPRFKLLGPNDEA
jgi:hypothetical protein